MKLMDQGVTFEVDELRVIKSKDGLRDVVAEVRFFLCYQGVQKFYVYHLPEPSEGGFVPLEDVTQEHINEWLETLPLIQKEEIMEMLENEVSPKEYMYKPNFNKGT